MPAEPACPCADCQLAAVLWAALDTIADLLRADAEALGGRVQAAYEAAEDALAERHLFDGGEHG